MVINEDDPDAYSRENLEREAIEIFDNIYDHSISWELGGRDHFANNLDELSDDTLLFFTELTAEQIESYADYGYDLEQEDPPEWLVELGWYDDDGEWHNPFWYH